MDAWLTRGIAEYVAGGTRSICSLSTLAQVQELVARFGGLNPIALHQCAYPDIPDVGAYYHVMFALSVKYRLDPAGGGQAKPGIRDVYIDARNGVPLAASFEANLGHKLQEFGDPFFKPIRAYLD